MDDSSPAILMATEFFPLQLLQVQIDFTVLALEGVALLILLLTSALISGSEVAFFSIKSNDLERFRSSASRPEKQIAHLLSDPKSLLATILIINNLVNVAIVMLSTYMTWQIFGKEEQGWVVVGLTMAVTAAIVFFGEIVPKVLAQQKGIPIAKFMSNPLSFFSFICKPLSLILVSVGKMVEKRFDRHSTYKISVAQINEVLDLPTTNEPYENAKKILKGIVNFGQKSVRQIMCARIDITAFEFQTPYHVLIEQIRENGYSRIPIYRGDLDNIVGILYAKDLLSNLEHPNDFRWQKIIRTQVLFVPDSKKIDALFRDFQKQHVHMAIVIDEYGGTSGLVTLEDIIEEIVGEINDEFDEESDKHFTMIDVDTFVFEAKTSLNDLSKELGLEEHYFDAAKGESESLGGLLLELFSKLPAKGERVGYKEYEFIVESVDRRRIKSVIVHFIGNHTTSNHPSIDSQTNIEGLTGDEAL